MGRVLNARTVVRNPQTTAVVSLPAGTEVPAWAEDLVGDHLTTGGLAAAGGEATNPPVVPVDPPEAPENPAPSVSAPPRAGRGSGFDAWKAHAESLGIEVPDDAQRDDVIELVDKHNDQ